MPSKEKSFCFHFNAVHPSCMDLTLELARRAARSPWQCIDCKTCNVCEDSGYAVSIKIFTTEAKCCAPKLVMQDGR